MKLLLRSNNHIVVVGLLVVAILSGCAKLPKSTVRSIQEMRFFNTTYPVQTEPVNILITTNASSKEVAWRIVTKLKYVLSASEKYEVVAVDENVDVSLVVRDIYIGFEKKEAFKYIPNHLIASDGSLIGSDVYTNGELYENFGADRVIKSDGSTEFIYAVISVQMTEPGLVIAAGQPKSPDSVFHLFIVLRQNAIRSNNTAAPDFVDDFLSVLLNNLFNREEYISMEK